MRRDGGPAFPRAAGHNGLTHREDHSCNEPQDGMTLRAFFAARAPAEIPAWFAHIAPPKNIPPMPDYTQLDGSHHLIVVNWMRDGCFDLPEEIAWFGKKVDAHRTGKADWNMADNRARYIQWRWAYADAMLAEMQREPA